ncbi:MAG: gluconokinase [Capsulimonadaceae bacterium]|nr:gluconokinase [Capsulimonadaceae bacterium]
MKPKSVLALDIGTSSVRASLFDRRGRPIPGADAQISYDNVTTADGGVYVDAETLLNISVTVAARAASSAAANDTEIAGVGISCFWHSLVGAGADNRAITPVYSWADTRSARYAADLRASLDEGAYHARTGCVFHPSYWPAKLRWLEAEHSALFSRVVRWMSFGEYLLLRVFGQSGCSLSMAAGTGLFDPNRAAWDPESFTLAPIRAEQLLPLVDRTDPVANATPEFARALGSLAALPWFPAVGDGACSNIGSGAFSQERIAINVGTSGAMRVAVEAGSVDIPDGLFCYRIDSGRFLVGGAVSCAGNVHAWQQEQLRLPDGSAMSRSLAAMAPDAHGLTVLPFWAGERSPGWHTSARATIAGMNLNTTSLDIARASHEAVAYTFASILDRLRSRFPNAREIVASGGAVRRNPAWVKIMADVFGAPVRISEIAEASSRGAALMALDGAGLIDGLGNAPAYLGRTFEPDPAHHEVYEKARERYGRLYDMVLNGFDAGE